MRILAFDPSGNYQEGRGTTGFTFGEDDFIQLNAIKSTNYDSRQAYWAAHKDTIIRYEPDFVVLESYKLFGHKSKQQIGSAMETPQLIGFMEMTCWERGIPVIYQDPSTKLRHSDDVLTGLGIIEKRGGKYYFQGKATNLHQRDSLRHYLYFKKYGLKKFKN